MPVTEPSNAYHLRNSGLAADFAAAFLAELDLRPEPPGVVALAQALRFGRMWDELPRSGGGDDAGPGSPEAVGRAEVLIRFTDPYRPDRADIERAVSGLIADPGARLLVDWPAQHRGSTEASAGNWRARIVSASADG